MQQPSSPKQTLKKFKQSKLSNLHGQPPSLSSLSVFKFQKDPIILLNEEIVPSSETHCSTSTNRNKRKYEDFLSAFEEESRAG